MWLEISQLQALCVCCLFSFLFVVSLYIWRSSTLRDRDEPAVIKQRLFSVVSVCILAPIIMLQFATEDTELKHGPPFSTWIGFPSRGFLYSSTIPVLLTASLFLGPMYLHLLQHPSPSLLLSNLRSGLQSLSASERQRLMALRNLVFAPLCEEFVFRTCCCSLLVAAGLPFGAMLLLSPALFALAHLHHLIGLVRSKGYTLRQAAIAVTAQLLTTSMFGLYAAFLYLGTGSLLPCVLCHAFCNHWQLPDLGWALNSYHAQYGRRLSIAAVFLLGIVVFAYALQPALELQGYDNWIDGVRQTLRKAEAEELLETAAAAADHRASIAAGGAGGGAAMTTAAKLLMGQLGEMVGGNGREEAQARLSTSAGS